MTSCPFLRKLSPTVIQRDIQQLIQLIPRCPFARRLFDGTPLSSPRMYSDVAMERQSDESSVCSKPLSLISPIFLYFYFLWPDRSIFWFSSNENCGQSTEIHVLPSGSQFNPSLLHSCKVCGQNFYAYYPNPFYCPSFNLAVLIKMKRNICKAKYLNVFA